MRSLLWRRHFSDNPVIGINRIVVARYEATACLTEAGLLGTVKGIWFAHRKYYNSESANGGIEC
jgi:hypothetical protein